MIEEDFREIENLQILNNKLAILIFYSLINEVKFSGVQVSFPYIHKWCNIILLLLFRFLSYKYATRIILN